MDIKPLTEMQNYNLLPYRTWSTNRFVPNQKKLQLFKISIIQPFLCDNIFAHTIIIKCPTNRIKRLLKPKYKPPFSFSIFTEDKGKKREMINYAGEEPFQLRQPCINEDGEKVWSLFPPPIMFEEQSTIQIIAGNHSNLYVFITVTLSGYKLEKKFRGT